MPASSTAPLPTPGSLLVATPALEDPNFHRTVLVMLAFSPREGALALVLNRPNEVPVDVILPGWGDLAAGPSSLFVGGPVGRDQLIGLGQRSDEPSAPDDGFSGVADGRLGTVDLHRQPYEMATRVTRLRIFTGHSGWAPGQLEGELSAGGWLVLPREDGDVFTAEPEELWKRVLRRQGGRLAMYANAPPNLSMN